MLGDIGECMDRLLRNLVIVRPKLGHERINPKPLLPIHLNLNPVATLAHKTHDKLHHSVNHPSWKQPAKIQPKPEPCTILAPMDTAC
jgi:hypothetical protein